MGKAVEGIKNLQRQHPYEWISHAGLALNLPKEDIMIMRLWHGRTAKGNFEAYTQFMRERAAPDYASVEGNLGCYFSRRLDDEAAHFLLVTLWESIDAVRAFAGPDPEVAKYYPEDDDFLLEKELTSQLYEVFHKA